MGEWCEGVMRGRLHGGSMCSVHSKHSCNRPWACKAPWSLTRPLIPAVQVLHCRELGINAMVVMEQYSELDTLLNVSKRLGVRPAIGIRAKLTTRHSGHWGSTSGGCSWGLLVL